jgi:hypothetical protein
MNDEVLQQLVNLAVMMCICDGEVHDDEESLLDEWMKSKRVPSSIIIRVKADAFAAVRGKGLNVKQVCVKMSEKASVSQKYDAIELCFRIAQSDGNGTDEEIRFLVSVGRWLELDYDEFRKMRDKILPVDLHEAVDTDFLLGLHGDMNLDEKLRHLTREFKRWNDLVVHSNPEKRRRAQLMVDIIAKKRDELRREMDVQEREEV